MHLLLGRCILVLNISKHSFTDIVAMQVLSSIALMHSFDKEGQASISHTDISPYQFIKMDDGNFVLNDFNRARFIHWNTEEDKPCGFHVANNPGKWR